MTSAMPSSSSSTHTPTFLITNISSLISVKLDSHNYLLWKSQFIPVLRASGLQGFIDGSYSCPSEFVIDSDGKVTNEVNPQFSAWIQQDQNVLCWINATLSENVLAHVVGLGSARAVWTALERRFASLSRSHIIQLKTQLQSIKKGSQTVSEYIQRIKHISDSLAAVSNPIDDDDLILYTLNGLPSEFGPFKTSIRTRSSPISIEELHVLLLCEELSIESTQSASTDYAATAFVSSKSGDTGRPGSSADSGTGRGNGRSNNINRGGRNRGGRYNNRGGRGSSRSSSQASYNRPCCQICNKTGHTALDCYHRMDYSYQGRNPPSQLAAMATSYNPVSEQNWYADSGATNHVTNDLQNLSIHSNYQGKDKVSVGNGQGLHIMNTGSSMIHTTSGSFHLDKILHVPSISSNLLSVHQFTKDNDCVFIFDSDGFSIQDRQSGKILFRGLSKNGLYPFRVSYPASDISPPAAFVGERTSSTIWHSRLGHPSVSTLKSLLPALPLHGSTAISFCEYCQFAKSSKLPFSSSSTVSHKPLELIHSDVWGPAPVVAEGGFKYYILFIDDFTKYTWFFPLMCKSDVFSVFLSFKLHVENLLSVKIKCFRSDGGGEYMSLRFQSLLKTSGIMHQISCPYTPEQNGCAERKHRHLVETGLTLLFNASMPLKYWADAFATATYLINRHPMKQLQLTSPWQKLFKLPPAYSSLRVFGCACYPWLRPYTPHKLDPRSKRCVFLGYTLNHKGYKCLDITTGRIYIS